ncbi:MAG: hypothetical protein HY678_05960, partial [Chloroflexi bacterium]|nr:hypothetical protein [Chloroflexota bacterium]
MQEVKRKPKMGRLPRAAFSRTAAILAIAVIAVACIQNGRSEPTPSLSPAAAPTVAATPTATSPTATPSTLVVSTPTPRPSPSPTPAATPTRPAEKANGATSTPPVRTTLTTADIVQVIRPSVVHVQTNGFSGPTTGTGVVFDRFGRIITNQHVIEDARQISVTLHDERV